MRKYNFINNVVGWIVFATALFLYLLTTEPTTSFWDCGEFIATSFKLEVGHPPGAALYMLIARVFSLFAPSVESVAYMINALSAICSAFCILFLFWSITHLARKVYNKTELGTGEIMAVMGAGLIGALSYTFSDTFWFSAVESEVYAMSSLFTALVFWLILKWEEHAFERYSNRWLILIALLMGLSIGAHLLNLLALPAIILVYYFKKYKITFFGTVKALLLSFVILGFIVWLIIPGLPTLASYVELFFVNTLGFAYNSGVLVFTILLFLILFAAIAYTLKKQKPIANTVVLCLTMIILGNMTLPTIFIRSNADTPINENDPSNVFSLISYINREQYGSNPLLSGETFASDYIFDKHKKPITTYHNYYEQLNGKYVKKELFSGYKMETMLFSRIFDTRKYQDYISWGNMKGLEKIVDKQTGRERFNRKPTMSENIKFMFNYQFGWMYWRYFMWNFAGRQNDIQGSGGIVEGNWISGIDFIDKYRLDASDKDLPYNLKENKGRNKYYFIPLILGLIGLIYQLWKDKKNFSVVMLLFIMTGIAIAFYLNMPPEQPRERDYVFAGSFYAFAIWIGFAVLAFYELFKKVKDEKLRIAIAFCICSASPIILVAQNFDDHNRSGRYIARAVAHNYFAGLDKDAILVSHGDNDTFPLWYIQETEGFRTDVRNVNSSLLSGGWYIKQMKQRVYESAPVPITFENDFFRGNNNNHVLINQQHDTIDAIEALNFVKNPANIDRQSEMSFIPVTTLAIPVDKELVIKSGVVPREDSALIDDYIFLKISGNNMSKSSLMLLDILVNNNWERPIYFTSQRDVGIGFSEYLRQEGFVYRFVPVRNDLTYINSKIMYDNLMNKYEWGNMNKPNVLVDHHCMITLSHNLVIRRMFITLAYQLINENELEKARLVLDKISEIMPQRPFFYNVGYYPSDLSLLSIGDAYCEVGDENKGRYIYQEFYKETEKWLAYCAKLVENGNNPSQLHTNLQYMYHLNKGAKEFGWTDLATKSEQTIMKYYKFFSEK